MPFENQFELEIKAFFFNAKTDYLPYYKSFIISVEKDIKLKELLKMIKERDRNFSYPEKDLVFRVNDLVVTGDEKVSVVVERLGRKLTIDPVSKYRSTNGLVINNSDFMHQFRRLLGHYSTKDDLKYYIGLYPLHYASETFKYNHNYIGDAILVLAHKMITDGNKHKEKILNAINDEFDGIFCCEYENNLFTPQNHTKAIAELKEMVGVKREKSLMDRISEFCNRKKVPPNVDSIKDKKVAIYIGNDKNLNRAEMRSRIEKEGAKIIEFGMSTKLAGQTLMDSNRHMGYKKAGTMMLDALDSGAEVLICSKEEDSELFKSILAESERKIGRDIDLAITSY